MTRKFVSILLCMALVFACFGTAGAEKTAFAPTLTNSTDVSAKTFTSSGEWRALFTVAIMMDYLISIDNKSPFDLDILVNPSFVGRNGSTVYISVLAGSKDQALIVSFDTDSKEAYWELISCNGQEDLEKTLKSTCADGYEANESAQLLLVYQKISEKINDK